MTAVAIPPHAADTALDLVAAVRAAAEAGVSDSYALAERLIADWSDEQCRVMLSALLPGYLRGLAERNAEAAAIQEVRERMARPRPEPAANRLTTAQRVNSWYSGILALKVSVGDRFLHLGDCTVHDLHDVASKLYHDATALNTRADRFVKLADHLEDHDLRTVADVDETTLKALLKGVAE